MRFFYFYIIELSTETLAAVPEQPKIGDADFKLLFEGIKISTTFSSIDAGVVTTGKRHGPTNR